MIVHQQTVNFRCVVLALDILAALSLDESRCCAPDYAIGVTENLFGFVFYNHYYY